MNRRHWAWLAGVLGALSVGTLACRSGGSTSTAKLDIDEVPVEYFRPSEYPVGREWRQTLTWFVSVDDQRLLYETWQESIAACMSDAGFSYTPVAYVAQDVGPLTNPLNEDVAREFGYHIEFAVPAAENLNTDDSPAFQRALAGDPGRPGCGGAMRRRVVEPVQEYLTLAEGTVADLERTLGDFTTTDEGRALVAAWSACMRDAGYDYSAPSEPAAVFGAQAEVSADEIAVRLRDLECDRKVQLTQHRSVYERKQVAAWLSRNEAVTLELERLRREFDEHVVTVSEGTN